MKVVIFGATGMVGQGVLRECLRDPGIGSVLTIGRKATGVKNLKLREIELADLRNYASIASEFSGLDACFFCLGASSAGMTQAEYEHRTFDIPMAAAEVMCRVNPRTVFVYISGAGTDSSERGSSMWARVKGRTENALLRLPFKAAYMFRPGVIRPLHGIRSKTKSYRLFYLLSSPILPLLQWALPGMIATTESIGLAMIEVARHGAPKTVLESSDILALSRLARSRVNAGRA